MRSLPVLPLLLFSVVGCASGEGGDDTSDRDGGDDGPIAERTCLSPASDRAGTEQLETELGTSSVSIADASACRRDYTLRSTATLRDGLPPENQRVVTERAELPTLRTGHDLFDGLYALALAEMRENSVDAISDGAFGGGVATPCPAGGCFETGRNWKYVWTRDTAYSVDLGLAGLDPQRARNSLEFKLSTRRGGGAEEIVQDTGTGGSYPVSTDRVTWAFGAAALLPHLEPADRTAFADRAGAALAATIERDRNVAFDAEDGLYTGEQSFLDWREQSYPAWTATDVGPIASSKALSTNLAHLRALELAAELATEATARTRYQGWADALRIRVRERFWLPAVNQFSTFTTTYLDPAPARQYDLLGSSLAILSGVASAEQAALVLAGYPHVERGAAPVLFPQQQLTAIYHNRAEWPFVTAYWLRAAAAADNPTVATRAIETLVRDAAVNLSNMENLELVSGAAYVDDGAYSGPIVNSQRQLWSVAGYLSMIHHTLFGMHFDTTGLRVAPYLPAALRDSLLGATDQLVLNDLPWRGATLTVVLNLPPVGTAGTYRVASLALNGTTRPIDSVITRDELDATNRLDLTLVAGTTGPSASRTVDSTDWRQLYAPRVPALSAVRRAGGAVTFDLGAGGEDTGTIRYRVYRDGEVIATDLPGTTAAYTDASGVAVGAPCYTVETCFTDGNCSQRAAPVCFWGDGTERIRSFYPAAFTITGGVIANEHGRPHVSSWGAPGDTLVLPSVQPAYTGSHLIQLTYGNGAGPLNTGITCAVKRIVVEDATTGAEVASQVVAMPQLGSWSRWSDSTFARAELDASKTYRITVTNNADTVNMSAFLHFATYGGTGGATEFNDVNISELKLLAR